MLAESGRSFLTPAAPAPWGHVPGGPEGWLPASDSFTGQARQGETTSADDRGHSPQTPAPAYEHPGQHASAEAPGAAGLWVTAGQPRKFHAVAASPLGHDD
jgi:hypothetical protein